MPRNRQPTPPSSPADRIAALEAEVADLRQRLQGWGDRVFAWMDDPARLPAAQAFTAGPERDLARRWENRNYLNWSATWPDRPGWYWFWGQYKMEERPSCRVRLAVVFKGGDGKIVVITGGHFLYKSEFAWTRWAPADLPALPPAPKRQQPQE